MNNPAPEIAVYMPTRNRAGKLEDVLSSIFGQSLQPAEVIIVDDASDDSTSEILSLWKEQHPILKVVRNETPQGAAASRNRAIRRAESEFITGVDDDDIWKAGRLEKLYTLFHEETCAGVCSYDMMDDGVRKRIWKKPSHITLDDLLYYNMAGNQILTRTAYIREVGGFDEALPSAQDYDLWIRMVQKYGPIRTLPEVLQIINIRQDDNRISTSGAKIRGYRLCFEKHRTLMTNSHIRYQNYRLRLAAGQSPGWGEMLRSTPAHLLRKEIIRKLFL
ncbi:MAG TPA: glycosyltransferase [Balneolaceae bacterium]|nr:glycosyltransferase [Balneolaceae bacterium]